MEIEASKKKKKIKKNLDEVIYNSEEFVFSIITWFILVVPITIYNIHLWIGEYNIWDYEKNVKTECIITRMTCNKNQYGSTSNHKIYLLPVNSKDTLTIEREVSEEVFNVYSLGKHITTSIPQYKLQGKYFEYEEAKPSTGWSIFWFVAFIVLILWWYIGLKFSDDGVEGFIGFKDPNYTIPWLVRLDIFTAFYPILLVISFIVYWIV